MKIETLAEGVTLYFGDCRDQITLNGSGPYLLSRKCTALQGRHRKSRSFTPRFICAICLWNPRPCSEACSFPPPPFLWLISNRRASLHPHPTHAITPRPTSNNARLRYRLSASVARPLWPFQALRLSMFGACTRWRTSCMFPQFGHGSRPKPVFGFHVQSHLRQLATALMGVLPHGLWIRLWRVNMPNIGDCHLPRQAPKWSPGHAN